MTSCHDPIIERLFVQATVRELNPKPAVTIPPTASLLEAVSLMKDRSIGSLLISDILGLHGVFTERDVLLRTRGLDFRSTRIEAVMTKQPRTVPRKISLARIVYEMATVGCRHLVLQAGKQLEVVSSTDVLEYLVRVAKDRIAKLGGPLDDLLQSPLGESTRGSLVAVSDQSSVDDAWKIMADQRKGCVAVIDQKRVVIGVLSERDLVRSVLAAGADPRSVTVNATMTHRPRTLPHTSSWGLAIGLMAEKHFRHIPVVDDGERAVGMVSVRDCFDRLAEIILKSMG